MATYSDVLKAITSADVYAALTDIASGQVSHNFSESTAWDVLHEGVRYAPKAVMGVAARRILGRTLKPSEFHGGEDSVCNSRLKDLGFAVVEKATQLTDGTVGGTVVVEEILRVRSRFSEYFEGVGSEDRRACLLFFAKSIDHVHKTGSDRWSVSVQPDCIRFTVGMVESIVLCRGFMRVLISELPLGVEKIKILEKKFKNAGGSFLCEFEYSARADILPELAEKHLDAMSRAAKYSMKSQNKSAHRIAVLKYLSAELAIEIANPDYVSTSTTETPRNIGSTASQRFGSEVDSEFLEFLSSFLKSDSTFQLDWLPRYAATIAAIRESIDSGDLGDAVKLIWRTQDNSVANAGLGVVNFDVIDSISETLRNVTLEISRDASPETFNRITDWMAHLKEEGKLPKLPTLLIARAFACIAPETYHTTVDTSKHELVVRWLEDHSSFRSPVSDNWAVKAAAMASYLSSIEVLRESVLVRNMFPWFIYEQIARGSDGLPVFTSGCRPRPEQATANISPDIRRVNLRHNVLTSHLHRLLVAEHGEKAVGTDQRSGNGGFVDVIVRPSKGVTWLYEIKVAQTASAAIREAIGQLLEYGFRTGGWRPSRLIVAAEPRLDEKSERYLTLLRETFALPIEYLRLDVPV